MDKQYSVQFFNSFVEQLQDLCRNYIYFSQFVDISGYINVEIDNAKKERYVLSELIQSSGNVVSESFCVKAFETSEFSTSLPHEDFRPSPQSRHQEFVMRRSGERRNQRQHERNLGQYQREATVSQSRSSSSHEIDTDNMNQRWQGFEDMTSSSDVSSSRFQPREKSDNSIKCEISRESSHLDSPVCSFPTGSKHAATDSQPETAQPVHEPETLNEVSASLPQNHLVSPHNVKEEPTASSYLLDEIEVIDLDMFEDEPETPVSLSVDEMSQGSAPVSNECLPVPSQGRPAAPGYSRRGSLKSGSRGIEHVIKYAVSQFRKYHMEKLGEDINMVSLPPERLNDLLLDFFEGVRKNDGGIPTASTLKNLQSHLHRYLRDEGYPHSIMKDDIFQSCRDLIKTKVEDMFKCGQSQKYVPVNEYDIEVMFQSKQLGAHNLESILNTMWVLNSKYMGIKRPSEHFNLKWGDIVLCQDDNGNEYLERRLTQITTFPIRVYAKSENVDRCFVSIYKEYHNRRPGGSTTGDEYPFYLRYARNEISRNSLFKDEAMSMHQLGALWRKIANESGLPVNKKIL